MVDFEKMMQFGSDIPDFMNTVGMKISKLEEGYAETQIKVTPDHLNFSGIVHGGCLYTLADVAAGLATFSFGGTAVTLSSSFNYLSAAPGSTSLLRAVAKAKKHGRTITVLEVEVFADDKLVCDGTFTYFTKDSAPVLG